MNRHLTSEELSLIADGALSPLKLGKLENHLAECPDCARELAFRRALEEAARSQPLTHTSEGFSDAVMAEILRSGKPAPVAHTASSQRRWRGWSGAALLGSGYLAIAIIVVMGEEPSTAQPSRLEGAYATLQGKIGAITDGLMGHLTSGPAGMIALALLTIGLLLLLDRILLQKLPRVRH